MYDGMPLCGDNGDNSAITMIIIIIMTIIIEECLLAYILCSSTNRIFLIIWI